MSARRATQPVRPLAGPTLSCVAVVIIACTTLPAPAADDRGDLRQRPGRRVATQPRQVVPAGLAGRRVFMALDGQQHMAASVGNTTITVTPGSTAHICAYLQDNAAGPAGQLNGYQLMWKLDALAVADASGTVAYVDHAAGPAEGDSIVVDTARADWIFVDQPIVLEPLYSEAPEIGLFGALYLTVEGLSVDPAGGDIFYLAEFDIAVSADACGEFHLQFNDNDGINPPPRAAFFQPDGDSFVIDTYQHVTVVVDCGGCSIDSDCDDDDACTADLCTVDGTCQSHMVDCSGQGDDCNTAACDPLGAEGNCARLLPVSDGLVCSGGAGVCASGACAECISDTHCGIAETCVDHACQPLPCDPSNCDDGVDCTVDACDPNTASCINTPDPVACDDGVPCTIDGCTSEGCRHDVIPDCAEGDGDNDGNENTNDNDNGSGDPPAESDDPAGGEAPGDNAGSADGGSAGGGSPPPPVIIIIDPDDDAPEDGDSDPAEEEEEDGEEEEDLAPEDETSSGDDDEDIVDTVDNAPDPGIDEDSAGQVGPPQDRGRRDPPHTPDAAQPSGQQLPPLAVDDDAASAADDDSVGPCGLGGLASMTLLMTLTAIKLRRRRALTLGVTRPR